MSKSNQSRKQIVEPCTRRCGPEVVGEQSLESNLFIYGLHMDAIKESTLKEIVDRVETFRAKSSNKVDQIINAHQQNEYDHVEGLAGRLADLCSQMGAVSMLRLCYQIQIGARHKTELTSLIKKLKLEHQNYSQGVANAS